MGRFLQSFLSTKASTVFYTVSTQCIYLSLMGGHLRFLQFYHIINNTRDVHLGVGIAMLWLKPKVLHTLGKHSTIVVCSQYVSTPVGFILAPPAPF